ncbi:uncharacterized protein LOC113518101 isoform X3 [Galleria mellonella]|uniref:Uncharacterized protein LOC113518101 isoform X3 n=1 Tax=Galleria mellonella TaxID=7137 RepID=A0A6J3C978_GALME|nr:uncharacterized protein LOC113518101 isoform X3 [Galleria mellonella]
MLLYFGLKSAPEGVGAYAYQDSAGNRMIGRRFFSDSEPLPPLPPLPFMPPLLPLQPFRFLPPLPPLLPLQRSNFLPFPPLKPWNNLDLFRSPFNNFPGFGVIPSFPTFGMSNFPNSAFAGGAAGPGFTHQIASINPSNPDMPNVDVMNRFADVSQTPGGNYVAMSSRAYSVSSNVNGKEYKDRGAETTVNNNGKITTYRVKS